MAGKTGTIAFGISRPLLRRPLNSLEKKKLGRFVAGAAIRSIGRCCWCQWFFLDQHLDAPGRARRSGAFRSNDKTSDTGGDKEPKWIVAARSAFGKRKGRPGVARAVLG